MLNTDKAWRKWGVDDPYFGVLADDRFAAAHIDQSREQFFATGRDFVSGLIATVERHYGPLRRGRALDHGCGVGRLTLPLAVTFGEIVALDVSPAMLTEATANATRAGHLNIRFGAADDQLTLADGQFDLVNSHLVIQHVPVRRGMILLDALIDRVAPGGVFHISISVRTDRGPLRWLYWASANVPGVKVWQNVCAGRAWNAPAMQMNDYPLGQIIARLASRSIGEVFVASHVEPRFMTCSLIGRKPA
jgi:SAM-dependent methyltransferase